MGWRKHINVLSHKDDQNDDRESKFNGLQLFFTSNFEWRSFNENYYEIEWSKEEEMTVKSSHCSH